MELKYKYEIGIHFKQNITLKEKQTLFFNISNYINNIHKKDIKNKELIIFLINIENILLIKSILNKNSNLIRYFYIENTENKNFI